MQIVAGFTLRHVRWLLWGLAAIAVVTSVTLALTRGRQPSSTGIPSTALEPTGLVGKPVPPLQLIDLQGKAVSAAQLQGRPVLLNFWATWCVPCRAEMPELEAESKKFGDRVRIVGVDEGESTADIQQFVAEIGVTYPIWRDPSSEGEKLVGATGLPYTLYIDRHGTVRVVRLGLMVRGYIDQHLSDLLAQK